MQGLMMDRPLLVSGLLQHADRHHGDTEIVSKTVKGYVAMCAPEAMPKANIPDLLCYEALLEKEKADFQWPSFDERTAACLCYTSGTTGNPKGALYGHRSTMLHAFGAALPDGLNVSARDVVLPVVPMFHVNAWGLPYSF